MANNSRPGKLNCNGHDLKQMALSGMAWLERNFDSVNALNVFPVPDGDTGTNMLLTMRSAQREIANKDHAHIGEMAAAIYQGALMGARGNSGVILSQLWRGFARGLEDVDALSPEALVKAFWEASKSADSAVQEPVEGTILTVARDGAKVCQQAVDNGITNPVELLQQIVEAMHRSVDKTPDLLVKDGVYVLRDAGVVDSGGMGLVIILEGMLKYLRGEVIESAVDIVEDPAVVRTAKIDLSGLEWPYDVQFLIHGNNLDVDEITRKIESMGDSALIVGDSSLLKVHVHVVNPGDPIGYAATIGQIDDVVVENMRLQYEEFAKVGGPKEGESASKPPVIEPGTIAVVTVSPGKGLTDIFYSLGAGYVISGGQTMNPSTEDFVKAITDLPTDKVIILPNNKNILMAAQQATGLVNGKQAKVVETRTIPQGISALLSLDASGDLAEVAETMAEASQFVETGEVTKATRTATVDGVKVKKDQYIGLHNDKLRTAGKDLNEVLLDLLKNMSFEDLELLTLYYGADVEATEAQRLVETITAEYPDHEIELRHGGQAHYYYILSAE